MPQHMIEIATDEEVRSGVLGRKLRQFNYGVVGEYAEVQPIWLNTKDDQGHLAAGLRGFVFLDWFKIELLFVEETQRTQGLGSALLAHGEDLARAKGAKNAWLDTFEWQARGFYMKQGYAEFGRIDGFIQNYYLALMKKAL